MSIYFLAQDDRLHADFFYYLLGRQNGGIVCTANQLNSWQQINRVIGMGDNNLFRPQRPLTQLGGAKAGGRRSQNRILRRRLQEASTSFQAVVEDVRKGLALDYLQQSNLSIDEIASLLGYGETPNFYRAFKRWTGKAPGAFR